MHDTAAGTIEYRFSYTVAERTCPLCGRSFEPSIGMWPFIAATQEAVCGRRECASAEEVVGTLPCEVSFEFAELDARTVQSIRDAGDDVPVAERFRSASLLDAVPEDDRKLLQLAAIDLQYCQADDTRIDAFEPRLLLRTCGEAAAEMLLSGCGDIL